MNDDFYILQRDAADIGELKVEPDLIYIDPPFGLNRDFHMEEPNGDVKEFSDKWENTDDFIRWYACIIESCFDKLGKHGWLYCHNNHISNALVLSKLSILKKYYTNISWKRCNAHNNIKKGWGNIVDSILVFRKGNPYFQVEYGPLDARYAENSFSFKDDKGYYALGGLTGEKSRMGKIFEYNGFNPRYGWRKDKDTIIAMDKRGEIHFGKKKPYTKIYAETNKGVPVQNFWSDIPNISRREGRIYPTQKPVRLLERIVQTSCPPDGLVVDPFCGGGTTLNATMRLGQDRKCITSDLSQAVCDLCVETYGNMMTPINTQGQDVWPLLDDDRDNGC